MSAANLILYFTMWALTEILQQNIARAEAERIKADSISTSPYFTFLLTAI